MLAAQRTDRSLSLERVRNPHLVRELPSVSVVLAAPHHIPLDAVAHLRTECAALGAELLVVSPERAPRVSEHAVRAVAFLSAPAGASTRDCRSLGMQQATGDIVIFVDEEQALAASPRVAAVARQIEELTATVPRRQRASGRAASFDSRPLLSVVMATQNAAQALPRSLAALAASDLPREQWELIVVDDGSADISALYAAEFADLVIRLPWRPFGRAYASNRGAEFARGEILVFVDSHVAVHAGALRTLERVMTADPELAAVSGIVDDRPEVRGLVSVYRGLLEHFAMRRGTGAHVLRTSCGALRRSAFEAADLFDEWHMFSPSATVHDLEMGARLAAHERSVTRNTDVRVTSLRSWTLWRMLKSDFRDRGVLLMRTIDARARARLRAVSLSHGAAPAEGFVCAGVVAGLAWLASGFTPLLHAALGLVIAGLVLDLPLFGFVVRCRGVAFALAALPVHLLAQLAHGFGLLVGWAASHLIGKPRPDPTTQAYAEVGVRTWPPLPRLR